MSTLNANATFYIIRKFLSETEKSLAKFHEALQRFGRKPGEPWHAAADDFGRSLEELREMLALLKGKTSVPGAERKELLAWANLIVPKMQASAGELRLSILRACPPLGAIVPPDQAAAKVWAHYERLISKVMDPLLEREAVQRLLRRAHDPAAVVPLVFAPAEAFAGLPQLWEYYSAVNDLVHNTPLPHFDGLTILGAMRKKFMEALQPGEPGHGNDFAAFMEGILSGDPQKRKAARRELDKLSDASSSERHGKDNMQGFPASRRLWAVWTGVKGALSNPDPAYRRAALCVLPAMRVSFLTHYFHDECINFIMLGLRDEDGMVRHKTLRFAADFVLIYRVEMPESVVNLQNNLKGLLSDKAAAAGFKASARKLIKEIAQLRKYDEDRGMGAEY